MRKAMVLVLALAACDGEVVTPDAGAPVDAGRLEDAGTDAPPQDTWSNYAQAFFATYCVGCHDTSPKDFRTLDDVRGNAETIRCGVSAVALDGCGDWPPPAQFPVGTGPEPSDEERARLVAWIDAGLPE